MKTLFGFLVLMGVFAIQHSAVGMSQAEMDDAGITEEVVDLSPKASAPLVKTPAAAPVLGLPTAPVVLPPVQPVPVAKPVPVVPAPSTKNPFPSTPATTQEIANSFLRGYGGISIHDCQNKVARWQVATPPLFCAKTSLSGVTSAYFLGYTGDTTCFPGYGYDRNLWISVDFIDNGDDFEREIDLRGNEIATGDLEIKPQGLYYNGGWTPASGPALQLSKTVHRRATSTDTGIADVIQFSAGIDVTQIKLGAINPKSNLYNTANMELRFTVRYKGAEVGRFTYRFFGGTSGPDFASCWAGYSTSGAYPSIPE